MDIMMNNSEVGPLDFRHNPIGRLVGLLAPGWSASPWRLHPQQQPTNICAPSTVNWIVDVVCQRDTSRCNCTTICATGSLIDECNFCLSFSSFLLLLLLLLLFNNSSVAEEESKGEDWSVCRRWRWLWQPLPVTAAPSWTAARWQWPFHPPRNMLHAINQSQVRHLDQNFFSWWLRVAQSLSVCDVAPLYSCTGDMEHLQRNPTILQFSQQKISESTFSFC